MPLIDLDTAFEFIDKAYGGNVLGLKSVMAQIPTVDPIEYLNSKGFAVTDQVWLDSKPCYTCEENNGYCVSCTKVEAWKSKTPLLL